MYANNQSRGIRQCTDAIRANQQIDLTLSPVTTHHTEQPHSLAGPAVHHWSMSAAVAALYE